MNTQITDKDKNTLSHAALSSGDIPGVVWNLASRVYKCCRESLLRKGGRDGGVTIFEVKTGRYRKSLQFSKTQRWEQKQEWLKNTRHPLSEV